MNKLSPEEQKIYKQALALLQQQDNTLDEGIKDSLKKLGITAAIAAALLATPSLGAAQKAVVKDIAPKATLAKFGQDQTTPSSQVLGVNTLSQWNELRDWLSSTTVNDIDGSGDMSVLMGNPKLDKSNFNLKMVNTYKKSHPKSNITDTAVVKSIQQAIINHRNGTIGADKKGSINLNNGEYRGTDYSTYLPHVSKIEQKAEREGDVDGIIGQFTSKVLIPRDLRSNPTSTYAPTPVKENKMTKQQLREAIRKIIRQELNEEKTIPNPNAGKWRIVGIESGNPLTKEFYSSKEEAQAASRKLRTKESGVKIIQLKDTIKMSENAPAPAKPATAPGVKEPPSKTPDKKEPRRPLGNPNVKPAPKAKATMKEAEMLKQVIKRFKSRK